MEIDGMEMSRMRDAAEAVATVAAAHEAGIFAALSDGPATPDAVAAASGCDTRAVRIVLPVLEAWGLLERDGDRWTPTERCRRALCDPSAPGYEGGGLGLWLQNLRSHTRLDAVLASGEPVERGESESDEDGLRRYMSAMAAAPEERIRAIVDGCLRRVPDAARVLDLGGGPGHLARAFVERGSEVVLLDTAETVAFVREEYGLDDVEGIEPVACDFREDPLPPGPFDLVLISNVVHIYGAEQNRELLAKVAGVTRPGGAVAIMDFVRGRSPRARRFALLMLLRTEEGDTWTEEELGGWLDGAGFTAVEIEDVDDERQLVTALRPRSTA